MSSTKGVGSTRISGATEEGFPLKRYGVKVLTAAAVKALGFMGTAAHGPAPTPPNYTAGKGVKINVMGEWAHPDDDTSIIGPCGVWHEKYGVKCGIIMVTRGEGGGNSAGPEIGPPLGLRRENEDRVAHFRSGTVDIFNLDKIDFFYNQTAPLPRGPSGTSRTTLKRVVSHHPHDPAGHLHRLHADARRRPWQPSERRPTDLGRLQGRCGSDRTSAPTDGPPTTPCRPGRSRRCSRAVPQRCCRHGRLHPIDA